MKNIRDFLSYYKPHKKLFFQDMLCAFLVAVADLVYPMIAKNMINDYVPNGNLRLFLVWSGVLLLIYIVKALLNYFIQYYGHVMGVRMQAEMREKMFQHLETLPFSYFDENKSGTIMSRLVNDLMDISELAHHGPEDLFLSLIVMVGSFAILCTVNVWLTVITFALLPFILLIVVSLRLKMSATFKKSREELGEVNANLENSISGIRVTRAYNNTSREEEKFRQYNDQYQTARNASYQVMGQFHSSLTFSTDILYLVVLAAGGIFFFRNQIDAGEFTMYLLYINSFLQPLRKLISFFEQYQNGMTGFERIQEVFAVAPEEEAENAITIESTNGDIRFNNVTFRYEEPKEEEEKETEADKEQDEKEKQKPVIEHLNLHIPKGKTVALVGPSGGGKTTLCHLIPRFYEISDGEILLDGVDIRNITRQSLRSHIGMVAQDVFLFTGSIRENIGYGNLDATEEEIMDAAKKANIHDYIMTLPDGYDTYVGERGIKLSGGQKQRISIARVFLKNPSILILDEATSALNNATEMLIQSALEELSRGRTTIVVAHRLSTIKNTDEIVVITDEGVSERGTHEELLQKGGLYSELYQYQFKTE